MTEQTASCRCRQLRAVATGTPTRISVCHCLDCQKRSGSAFAAQVRFPAEQVAIEGRSKSWMNIADSGNRITFHFCADCGSDVHYEIEGKFDGLIAIPLGAFDDPSPRPTPCGISASIHGLRLSATTSSISINRPKLPDKLAGNCRPSVSPPVPGSSRA